MNDDQPIDAQDKPVIDEKVEEADIMKSDADQTDELVEEKADQKIAESNAVATESEQPEEKTEVESEQKEPEVEAKEAENKPESEEKAEPAEPTDEEILADKSDNGAKWFIVHTYSGHEDKVAKSLKQRVETMGYEKKIFDIIVPVRDTIKVSGGKKETVKEKIFPGYVLVKMILDDESWLLVRTTQGVTAFIGSCNKPTTISEKEVEAIQKFMKMEEPLYKATFTTGEAVKIVDGPFSDFLGTIDNIDETKGKLRVLVSIFGRETPVELDFLQVSKL